MSDSDVSTCECPSDSCKCAPDSCKCPPNSPSDLPPPVELTHTNSPNDVSWNIPPDVALKTLSILNTTWSFLSSAASFVWKVGKGIWKSVLPENYVFFNGSGFPYNIHDLNLNAPGVAAPEWYYNASRRIFISAHLHDTSDSFQTHHLPFLSAEVKYNDLMLYDITEFMEAVRWAGDGAQHPPSASVLLGAWALETGVVLHASEHLKLVVIDDEGSEKTFALRS